ncbi:Transcriptional regulator containing HTH domain,ArsR family [Halorhabdus sp. SVX81]|uniref:ArsR/SmtB family transcription factor n=1 Tax=Halorhabdus sp. SVX81 TaxID=2978283 RepID=UPI0023DB7A53|nr:helix-turn-helix domain-containing protein [Halorhabdus sp. SVX81]WEL18185.1 Transcriptional regulator containing HTH domain,ArsR family [Halorhabdus sp. SVX81]
MTSLLPLKSATQSRDRDLDPQLLGLTEESAGDILSAISSLTARRILDILYDEPRPTSEIATTLDSSVQNVSYHLERLEDADLVEVVDTWYSAQGREMDVYGPTNSALVLYTGAETAPPSLKRALGRSVGGIGAIGVISALVHFQWTETGPFAPSRRVAPIGAQPPEPTIQESIMNFITGPGGTLLTAGLVVIAVCLLWWYWRRYRPAREQAQSI